MRVVRNQRVSDLGAPPQTQHARAKTRSTLRTPTWWIQEPGAAVPPGDARTRSCARCPHPDDGLLQLYICCRTPGRRPHDAVAIFCRDGGVAVLVPSPSFLTMLDLTPLTSRMWLRDCPATTGQNGRQIAPGSSFSEVSPAITLPSRCLANASNLATSPVISPVPGSPEPASCKIMTSLTILGSDC